MVGRLTDAVLRDQYRLLLDEVNRRSARWDYDSGRDQLVLRLQTAEGRAHQHGEPWVKPTGEEDSYQLGSVVEHEGREYVSLVVVNVADISDVSAWGVVQPESDHDGVVIEHEGV